MGLATDGSIHPKEALKEAAEILIHHFMLFSDEKITGDRKTPTEEARREYASHASVAEHRSWSTSITLRFAR